MEARGVHSTDQGVPSSAVDLAFTDLAAMPDTVAADEYHGAPLIDLLKRTPPLMGISVLAGALFAWLGWQQLPQGLLIWWLAVLAIASIWIAYSARSLCTGIARHDISGLRSRTILFGALVGGVWAACPSLFLADAPEEFRIVVVAVVMGISGLGAVVLSRLPWVGVTFSSLLTSALALSLAPLSGRSALIVWAYGIALALVVVLSYRREAKYASQLIETRRQAEIIALLLREFEAGSSDWIWETGPDGRLTYVSDRMAELLGRSRERLVGATLLQAAGRARRSGTWRQVAQLMAGHDTLGEILVPVSGRSGSLWWQLTARPLLGADGSFRGYRGVGKDVTARRHNEINVFKAKEAAERESKTKSEFLAVMSHELRTPLNAIVGFSQILAEEKEGPHANPNYAEYAGSIRQSGCHLASLINDILDITRFERGNISLVEQELDLVELIDVCLRMCRQAATDSQVTLVQKHAFAQIEVSGDLTRLRQILINLVTNAIKFSPCGGSVSVSADHLADGRIAASVTDNGIGIDPAKLERIFEPFAQVDGGISRRFGGLGLGLAIARRLARLHGGDIVIASRPNAGTVARLVLPASRVLSATPSAVSAEAAA